SPSTSSILWVDSGRSRKSFSETKGRAAALATVGTLLTPPPPCNDCAATSRLRPDPQHLADARHRRLVRQHLLEPRIERHVGPAHGLLHQVRHGAVRLGPLE